MRARLFAVALGAVAAIVVLAGPAAASCTFTLDRESTTPGGEFYGLGTTYTPGESVEIRWNRVDGPIMARVLVSNGSFRQHLTAPADAKPGWYIVYAVSLTQSTAKPSYALRRAIEVVDPAAPAAPAAGTSKPAKPDLGQQHEHLPVPAPAANPQPAPVAHPATRTVPAAQPAFAPKAVPVANPVPALQPASAPALEPVPALRPAPAAQLEPGSARQSPLSTVLQAFTAPESGALVVPSAAMAAAWLLSQRFRRRRFDLQA
ncbi:MAG TPA: hypothetical protein VNE62_08155 [Actinomycetota bacterium]|nr:hypothetical protein [Actinomycetota bacterium]